MLDKLSAEKTLNPRGVVGCSRQTVWAMTLKSTVTKRVPCDQRQPPSASTDRKNRLRYYCLADFVAPKLSGKADYIGDLP